MSRYIDADRLLADLPKLCHSINDSNVNGELYPASLNLFSIYSTSPNCRACPLFDTDDDMCKVEDFIHSQPDADVFSAANVAEQKKGNWIQTALGVLCSQCRYRCQSTGVPSFCPNCGARMGGMMIP